MEDSHKMRALDRAAQRQDMSGFQVRGRFLPIQEPATLPMLLAVLIAAVLAIQVGWHCKSIRSDFTARGLRVERIRWRPIERFLGHWSRRQMLYRVWYVNGSGEAYTCLAVVTLFEGLTIEDERRNDIARASVLRGAAVSAPRNMKLQDLPWFAATASAISFLAIGVQYWSLPQREVELPSSLIGPGLVLLAAASTALQFREPRRWRSTLVVMSLAPIAVVSVRIAADLSRDPTSHNLFPFELVIAGFVAAVAVGLGMSVGGLLRRVMSPAGAR